MDAVRSVHSCAVEGNRDPGNSWAELGGNFTEIKCIHVSAK